MISAHSFSCLLKKILDHPGPIHCRCFTLNGQPVHQIEPALFNHPLDLVLHTNNVQLRKDIMNSVADLWVRSGRNPERLYQGSTEDIVKELKAWVERRKTHNNVAIEGHWDMFRGIDSIQELSDQSAGIQKGQISGVMDQVYAITATQLANLERNRVSHLSIP